MDNLLNRFIVLSCLLLGLVISPIANAVEVQGLYQVEVPVKDQSNKTLWEALVDGFKEVLVRKSGSEQILSSEEYRSAARKVRAYVQLYQYLPVGDPQSDYPFLLKIDFSENLIDELIQSAGMPIWGSNRPVTILWLAKESNLQREIVKEEEANSELARLLKQNATRRGIPMILPLMDLDDQLNVTISDIWGRFSAPIVAASSRYGADSVVTGRVSQIGEQWQAKLIYINQGEQYPLEIQVDSIELLSAAIVDAIAARLCEKYCVVEATSSRQIKIHVSGVGSFAGYKNLQSHLESLSSIRKVEVDKVIANQIRFMVTLLGDLQSVKDGIALGRKLTEIEPPEPNPFAIVDQNQINKESSILASDNLSEQSKEPQGVKNNFGSLDEEIGEALLNSDAIQTVGFQDESEPTQGQLNGDQLEKIILYYRWNG